MPKPMKAPSGGRADRIIADLERLHREAHKIFDAYVDELRLQSPGIPFGVIKGGEITGRAGLSLNYVARPLAHNVTTSDFLRLSNSQ